MFLNPAPGHCREYPSDSNEVNACCRIAGNDYKVISSRYEISLNHVMVSVKRIIRIACIDFYDDIPVPDSRAFKPLILKDRISSDRLNCYKGSAKKLKILALTS